VRGGCDTSAGRKAVYEQVARFTEEFNARNGSLVCRELLGCDICTPQGRKQAIEQNLFTTTCVRMVEDAAAILEGMASRQTGTARGD